MESLVWFIVIVVLVAIVTPYVIYTWFVFPALAAWVNSFYPLTPLAQTGLYWGVILVVWILFTVLGIIFKEERTLNIRRG